MSPDDLAAALTPEQREQDAYLALREAGQLVRAEAASYRRAGERVPPALLNLLSRHAEALARRAPPPPPAPEPEPDPSFNTATWQALLGYSTQQQVAGPQ